MPALGGILSTTGVATEASPALSGTPTAPTAAVDTNTTQLATTAYVVGQGYAKLASPSFSGTPSLPTGTTAVTQSAADSTTKLATTAFVTTADNLKANLASPALTGTPTAPTAVAGTSTTQIATTAFVATSFAPLASPTFTGTPAIDAGSGTATATLTMTGRNAGVAATTTQVVSTTGSYTWTIPTGQSYTFKTTTAILTLSGSGASGKASAPIIDATSSFTFNGTALASTHLSDSAGLARLASPALTGTPTAPTAAVGTNTTQLATTAFVLAQSLSTPTALPSSRAVTLGTAYQPSSTRGTLVNLLTAQSGATGLSISVSISATSGGTFTEVARCAAAGNGQLTGCTFIVPTGFWYKVAASFGSAGTTTAQETVL